MRGQRARVAPTPVTAQDLSHRTSDEAARRSLLQLPMAAGRPIALTIAAAGTATARHLLGAQPRGWFVTDLTGGGGSAPRRTAWTPESITIANDGATPMVLQLWIW